MEKIIYRIPPKKLAFFISITGTSIVILYSILVIGFRVNPRYDIAISNWVIIVLSFMAIILGGYLSVQKSKHFRIRRGWRFITIAMICKLIGNVGFVFWMASPSISLPILLIDALQLSFFPLFLIGILSFPFQPLKRQDFILFLLDLAIVLVTMGMILWYFIFTPIIDIQSSGLMKVITMAFPTGDLILLAGLIVINQREIHRFTRTSLIFLMLSIVLASIPDAIFSYIENNQLHTPLSDLNIFWQASVLCLIYAAAWQIFSPSPVAIETQPDHENQPKLQRLIPSYFAAAIGPVLLVGIIKPNAICQPQFSGLLTGVVAIVVLVFTRQHVVLMDNYHLYKFNRKLATIDGLTKAYNRQFFNDVFGQSVEEANRFQKPLSVLLIDVDGFKSFNDKFGHLTGDVVLKTIANVLAGQIRKSDILARYGGDEFAIILKETDLQGAYTVTKKIHQAMENQSIADKSLSVSVGEAELHNHQSPEQLLEEADRELYRHKSEKSLKR